MTCFVHDIRRTFGGTEKPSKPNLLYNFKGHFIILYVIIRGGSKKFSRRRGYFPPVTKNGIKKRAERAKKNLYPPLDESSL